MKRTMQWLPGSGLLDAELFGVWFAKPAAVVQFFEQALLSKLQSLAALSTLATGIFKTSVPQTHDLGAIGPALTYEIPNKPFGHVLTGSDGTATATAKISAWSYNYGISKQIAEAVWTGIDGVPAVWGNGTCEIISVVQQDDDDEPIQPRAGTDQWIYRVNQVYQIMYRVTLPNLI